MALDRTLLEQTIARIIDEFKAEDKLHEVTPRVVRTRVEEELELSAETTQPYKQLIKEIALRLVNETPEEQPSNEGARDSDGKENQGTKVSPEDKPKSKGASTKKRKRAPEFKSNEMIGDSDEDTHPIPVKQAKKKKASTVSVKTKASAEVEKEGSENEEEATISDKEKPKKGRKKDKAQAKSKGKKATSSKDEDPLKRLKSLVLACGVRKVWSKEFAGIEDKPHLQERKIREILKDLGMEGRLTMEKAKQLKEKRDMERELADVQEFHNKMSKQSERATSKSDPESDSEEGNAAPAKRKAKNARQSIMAFLGDQSSDEE